LDENSGLFHPRFGVSVMMVRPLVLAGESLPDVGRVEAVKRSSEARNWVEG
jgi:hypothetical protein